MNRLSLKDRAQIIGLLVEGNSLRSITRITGKSINTVTKLVVDVGYAASIYQHEVMRNLPCKLIQCDEIWSFCYAKERNVAPGNKNLGHGDVWTWTAICADTKLVPSFFVGNHSAEDAQLFIRDLESRLANRVQLTTDGLQTYLSAVQSAFGSEVDYAQLQKTYGSPERTTERRYVERQNLTMRMGMRRFTRLTNGFSKKIENHILSVALHFMHYNFGRIHKTLRVTPAMQAGISDHVWSLEEIAKLAD